MTTWRDRFTAWADVRFPESAFRLALHDYSLVPAALALVLKNRTGRLLVVTADQGKADQLNSDISAYMKLLGDSRPLIPVNELTLGKNQYVPENEAGRCAALEAALDGYPAIFITTVPVLLSKTLSPKGFAKRIFSLKKGQTISPEELAKKLVELDYDNEFEVQMPGEFAHRGGILDIYSPLYDAPVRLEFWGDEIDNMRFFLPETQRSFKEVNEIRVIPRGAAVLDAEDSEKALVRDFFPSDITMVLCGPDLINEHLRSFFNDAGIEAWSKWVTSASGVISLITEPGESSIKKRLGGPVRRIDAVSLGSELTTLLPEMGDGAVLWHWQQLRDNLIRWTNSGYTLVACCGSDAECERFKTMLSEDPLTKSLPVEFEHLELANGIMFPEAHIIMLSDKELFGRKPPQRRRKHVDYRQDMALRSSTDLEEGGLAVHVTHGICIYHGVHFIEKAGDVQEVIELEFADDVRLYVPVEDAVLVSRYMGAGKSMPALSRLGGNVWKNTKEAAGNAAWDLAAELLRMEAVRQRSEGVVFKPNIEWERSFTGSFPYTETPDQMDAIQAVLEDMGQPKPMDRLLCGDVGYGKTEVAMRAAFRAVLNGKQVAVLVPTTILCQQHYQSFTERMNEFPLTIEMLSRFKTAGEQADILARTARGEVDILIGTHRLLSPDVSFASLGLLIIDEEQRFGVKDKQRLKAMRANLDILTMTATPIPRTLYFSLSGIRNLSTIMTAPTNRLPVTTVVGQFDKELMRQAILRELERDGQTYVLHNRVQSIDKFAQMIRDLVPQARVVVAHGQMSPGKLEDIMTKFVRHDYDVLVCTTIIESGMDIQNANTIIIDRADRFGLSELYQLRGRVGRTDRQAYAYLLLPPMGALPQNARERLEAIRRYTHLGAGFKLALRDLEIRGAGNILGTEQSGHIAAVGFELYCQLLKEAVARLEKKDVSLPHPIDMSFDKTKFAISATDGRTALGIPVAYVGDQGVRIDCYKTLSRMLSIGEVDGYELELKDRFGPLPDCTKSLLDYTRVRILAQRHHIIRLHVRDGRLVMETQKGLYKTFRNEVPRLKETDGASQLKEVIGFLEKLSL
ncbi:MAG: transcription-repair coupling factor [Victivallales bacterium]|nr:transcription-repair coupling factor [Victivallales bacterium]